MDEISQWINNWIVFSQRTRELFAKNQERKIDSLEFLEAFVKYCGKETGIDLLYNVLPTPEEAYEKLKECHFESGKSDLVEEICLEEDILPEGILRLITEETVRSKGQIWRIHANDQDPFPSIPHAHNLESGLKLHLGTGDLYRKKQLVGRVTCKHLKLIRDALKEATPPKLECK